MHKTRSELREYGFNYCCRSKDLESSCDAAALQGVGLQAVVTEYLITYADLIFSDKLPSFSGDSLQSELINPIASFSLQRLFYTKLKKGVKS